MRYAKAIAGFIGALVGAGANYALSEWGIVIPEETQVLIVGGVVSLFIAAGPANKEKAQ